MIIKIEDPIWSKADKEAIPLIAPCLQYKDIHWRRFKKRRVAKTVIRYRIDRRSGLFLTGLIPRVKQYLRRKGIKIKVIGRAEKLQVSSNWQIKGITYRTDQERILKAIARKQRGFIKSPTGSGKTVIAMGVSAMFKNTRRLFLCHTKDLMRQTYEEFLEKGFDKGQILIHGGGSKTTFEKVKQIAKKKNGVILIALIQSYVKFNPEDYIDFWDVVLIDECHHCVEIKSSYSTVMHYMLTPVRLGFTATPPPEIEKRMLMEGLLGQQIGELTVREGIDLGILAKPKLKLISVPHNSKIAQIHKTYRSLYQAAVVESRSRNGLIAEQISNFISNGDSVLVMIREIDHGKEIKKILDMLHIKCRFVHGSSEREERIKVAKRLEKKKILCVICSTIWKEGINIKTLNAIINAGGGKDEKGVIQVMGRGLRIAEGKENVTVIDFLDPYKFLAEHTVARINTYVRENLL